MHVDHGLRPQSDREQCHVAALAGSVGAVFDGRAVRVEPGANLEARRGTRATRALEPRARTDAASSVLVGHTADDQAETVLLNVLRGAAAAGLAGMRARRGRVVRPLLGHAAGRDWRRCATRSGSRCSTTR